jgi:hypothetical protein
MMTQARRAAERELGQALGLGEGVGEVGWMSTRQVRTAAAVLPVALRNSAKTAFAVVPVTLTPFWLRQLLNAASAELLIVRPKPPPKPPPEPAGAYLAHALNAAESRAPKDPVKDGRGRGDLVGNALGEKDPRGRPANCPGLIVTPCCFRHVWNALSFADVVALALEVAAALLVLPLLPPQPVSTSVAASTGSAPRTRNRRSVVPPFMMISSDGG